MKEIKKLIENKKVLYTVIGVLLLIIALMLVKGFSGEDDWRCDGGRWVKHGNPSQPMPTTKCR